ncbi:Uncharacterised protein [Vibrio cholerae]|nr:Uncharacterised protein [Vibrio cholerae]
MTGFCRSKRQANGFLVTQLTDEDHIWVFTQCRAQCIFKTVGITVHFALVDQTLIVAVHKFNRIFNGQNMLIVMSIDIVHHRRQGRRLTRARWPSH